MSNKQNGALAEQPAQQEPVAITEQMAFAFHNAITDGALGTDDMMDIMRGLEAAFAHITTPQAQSLTDEQKYAMYQRYDLESLERFWYEQGVEDAEAAHGINAKGGAA